MRRRTIFAIIVFVASILALLVLTYFVVDGKSGPVSVFISEDQSYIIFYKKTVEKNDIFLLRNEINNYIKKVGIETVVPFYRDLVLLHQDPSVHLTAATATTIARTIIKYSLEKNVPVNLAFALAKRESGFYPRAVNINSDGTIDRGLFQLNNGHRKSWKITDYFDIDKNTKEALQYLSERIGLSSDIPLSLIAYNCGQSIADRGVIPDFRKDYVNFILDYEDVFNRAFNEKFNKS